MFPGEASCREHHARGAGRCFIAYTQLLKLAQRRVIVLNGLVRRLEFQRWHGASPFYSFLMSAEVSAVSGSMASNGFSCSVPRHSGGNPELACRPYFFLTCAKSWNFCGAPGRHLRGDIIDLCHSSRFQETSMSRQALRTSIEESNPFRRFLCPSEPRV